MTKKLSTPTPPRLLGGVKLNQAWIFSVAEILNQTYTRNLAAWQKESYWIYSTRFRFPANQNIREICTFLSNFLYYRIAHELTEEEDICFPNGKPIRLQHFHGDLMSLTLASIKEGAFRNHKTLPTDTFTDIKISLRELILTSGAERKKVRLDEFNRLSDIISAANEAKDNPAIAGVLAYSKNKTANIQPTTPLSREQLPNDDHSWWHAGPSELRSGLEEGLYFSSNSQTVFIDGKRQVIVKPFP